MILKVADLLHAMARREEIAIERKGIKHAPTIGAMYEAMTADILQSAIPLEAHISVLNGFVRFADGTLSGQMDCMIAQGEGEKLHDRLDGRIVPLANVIAVIEVKKTLYHEDMRDSFEHLRQIPPDAAFENRFRRLHADATNGALGLRVDLMETVQDLSPQQREVMAHITRDVYRPARIALGYHGYKSHSGFRSAMSRYLQANVGAYGFGPANFPDLMISGRHCLVKMNGIPYSSRMAGDFWPFLASYSGNPIIPLLEVLWTRLVYAHLVPYDIFGADLYDETLPLFIKARYVPGPGGWEFAPVKLTEKTLSEAQTTVDYAPVSLTELQFTVISRLCHIETVAIDDPDFVGFLRSYGADPESFVASLVATGLVSVTDGQLCLLTRMCQCAVLPDGRFVAGENVSGRFQRWLSRRLGGNPRVLVLRAARRDATT